jgi:hypothetical protein
LLQFGSDDDWEGDEDVGREELIQFIIEEQRAILVELKDIKNCVSSIDTRVAILEMKLQESRSIDWVSLTKGIGIAVAALTGAAYGLIQLLGKN